MNPPIYHNQYLLMEPYQSFNQHPSRFSQLKDSIRDILQLQSEYQLSDELFWEAFDSRVLLNRPLNILLYTGLNVRA